MAESIAYFQISKQPPPVKNKQRMEILNHCAQLPRVIKCPYLLEVLSPVGGSGANRDLRVILFGAWIPKQNLTPASPLKSRGES